MKNAKRTHTPCRHPVGAGIPSRLTPTVRSSTRVRSRFSQGGGLSPVLRPTQKLVHPYSPPVLVPFPGQTIFFWQMTLCYRARPIQYLVPGTYYLYCARGKPTILHMTLCHLVDLGRHSSSIKFPNLYLVRFSPKATSTGPSPLLLFFFFSKHRFYLPA